MIRLFVIKRVLDKGFLRSFIDPVDQGVNRIEIPDLLNSFP